MDVTRTWYYVNYKSVSVLEKQMNLLTQQKQIRGPENRLGVAKGLGGGKDWVFGASRCRLLYIGWINNKVLLYSTGNYIQSLGMNPNGKEYGKSIYIYIYIYMYY